MYRLNNKLEMKDENIIKLTEKPEEIVQNTE